MSQEDPIVNRHLHPDSLDTGIFQSDKNDKLKDKQLKKVLKRSAKGECNSKEMYRKCVAAGVFGLPQILPDASVIKSRKDASYHYDSSELRGLLAALLLSKEALPISLQMRNRFFARNIVVLHVSDWKDSNSEAFQNLQLLLNEVNEERADSAAALAGNSTQLREQTPLQTLAWVRVSRRAEIEILTLPHCLFCVPTSLAEKEFGQFFINCEGEIPEQETGRKNNPDQSSRIAHHSIRDRDEQEPSTIAISADAYEPLVAPEAVLQMWGYPWLEREKNDGMQALFQPLVRGQPAEAASKSTCSSVDPSVTVCASAEQNSEEPAQKRARLTAATEKNDLNNVADAETPVKHNYGSCWHLVPTATDAMKLSDPLFHNVAVYGGKCLDRYGVTCTKSDHLESLYMVHEIDAKQQAQVAGLPARLVAVDCEMVMTAAGSELARLTLVNAEGDVMLDVYVMPELPVIDYVTEYSGITASVLATHQSITLAQAQIAFLRIVSSETIVVGHSPDADTKALRVVHKRFIDTALIYPHPRGFPLRIKLSQLAFDHLKINIQSHVERRAAWREKNRQNTGLSDYLHLITSKSTDPISKTKPQQSETTAQSLGHDSVEDARTALALVQLKAKKGMTYGLSMRSFANSNGSQGMPLLALAQVPSNKDPDIRIDLSNAAFFWDNVQTATEHATFLAGAASGVVQHAATEDVVEAAATRLMLSDDLVPTDTCDDEALVVPPLTLTSVCIQHCLQRVQPNADDQHVEQANPLPLEEELMQRNKVVKHAIHKLLDALAARARNNRGGGLLLLTAQRSIAEALALRQRQYLCTSGSGGATWNVGDQRKLAEAAKIANLGVVSFATVQ